jgi:plasmid maintenance system antidote protein VapI
VAGVKRELQRPKSQQPKRQVRHIGRIVAEELAARQWSERRFWSESGLSLAEVRAVLAGSVLTLRAAEGIARAFNGSADTWLEVEAENRERQVKKSGQRGWS